MQDVERLDFIFQPLVVPWCSMFKSIRVWAILVANLTTDWGLYFLLTSIPLYMSEVLKLDISTVSRNLCHVMRKKFYTIIFLRINKGERSAYTSMQSDRFLYFSPYINLLVMRYFW